MVVLKGFVDTRLDLPPLLTALPDAVTERVFITASGNGNVVYVKPVRRIVVCLTRAIPEGIFKE